MLPEIILWEVDHSIFSKTNPGLGPQMSIIVDRFKCTLESRIVGGVAIIWGLDIVIIINNRGVGIIGGVGRG